MKKKLLFVINQLYKGGAETSLVNLLHNLDENIYEIDLIVMNQFPVENAVSLIPKLPASIRLCDAFTEYQRISLFQKIKGVLYYTHEQKNAYFLPALLFVKDKEYDWAFHIGEWSNPSFVAKEVCANTKAAWIHSDISKASYFDDTGFFTFLDYYNYFIFVSNNSLKTTVNAYPFLKEKAKTIYNILDVPEIKRLSFEPIAEKEFFQNNLPVVVTCANIRNEKNHLRQVRVMSILKQRGLDFIWLNLGATADQELCKKILDETKKYNLEDKFILAGPKNNPFQYVKNATVVAVLSDHESWSMVITEAKALGVPVISTPTSGALEQIENKQNGVLCRSFSVNDIADSLQELLESQQLQNTIRENLSNFNNTSTIIQSFNSLIENSGNNELNATSKDLLYIIDDINYMGGAHVATKLQINELIKLGRKISIFSSSMPYPHIRRELVDVNFLSWKDLREDQLFNWSLLPCIMNKNVTKKEKKYRIHLFHEIKVKKNKQVFEELVLPNITKLFSGYEVVCVMSEGSTFKKFAAESDSKKKVQWIHIDYCDWMNKTQWNRYITKDDGVIFGKFDNIVVLSPNIKETFCKLYPHLKEKVIINPNLMPTEQIRLKAQENEICNKLIKFVTVGRVDYQKAYHRLFEALLALYYEGYRFHWTVVGNGNDYNEVTYRFYSSPLKKYVEFLGNQENPFPYVKKADVFALMSDFEGLPNTIYEALILGVPVIATNTGGVCYQVTNGETGWLVENTFEGVYNGIKYILEHLEEINQLKTKLLTYTYNNNEILKIARQVLSIDL